MSILFTSNHGWIISHVDYINAVYANVQDCNQAMKSLKFNQGFFKVNSQYLRQSQIESSNKNQKDDFKRRKRKKLQLFPQDVLEQNKYVQQVSKEIIDKARELKLFVDSIKDNNEESRLESKKFYINRLESHSNYAGSNQEETAVIREFQNEKYVFPRNSNFYCYDIRNMNEKLCGTKQFDLILLDPPWWNKSIRRKKVKFGESSYNMMYNEELAKIPIDSYLNLNGTVAVWCTNSSSQIKSIIEEIFPAWGVTFKAKWYWLKVTQNGEPICDFNDTHGKQPYEQILFGSKSTNTNFDIPDKKVFISIPSAVHSHKPPLIEILKNYLPKDHKCIEIFARYLLPNWTSWGMEVLKFQHLSLYSMLDKETVFMENDTKR